MTKRQASVPRRADDREMRDQIQETHHLASEASGRISTHEAVCAERFAGILARFSRAEKVVYTGGVMLIGAMGTVIIMLINLLDAVK